MGILEQAKAEVQKFLPAGIELIYPPDTKLGDFCLPCFSLGKEQKKNPVEVAQTLKEALSTKPELKPIFSDIKSLGGYVNFYIASDYLAQTVWTENKVKPTNKKILLEYSNINTHKDFHIGHLRNICYGEAIKNILNALGNCAIPLSYINDFGIHTAKTVWRYSQLDENQKEHDGEKGKFLGELYAQAEKQIQGNDENKEK